MSEAKLFIEARRDDMKSVNGTKKFPDEKKFRASGCRKSVGRLRWCLVSIIYVQVSCLNYIYIELQLFSTHYSIIVLFATLFVSTRSSNHHSLVIILIAEISTLNVNNIVDLNIWKDVVSSESVVESRLRPASSRSHIALLGEVSLVQTVSANVKHAGCSICLLPLPPHTIHIVMVHEESWIAGRTIDIGHL